MVTSSFSSSSTSSSSSSMSPSRDLVKGLILGTTLSTGALLLLQTIVRKRRSLATSRPHAVDEEGAATTVLLPVELRTEALSRTALYFPATMESRLCTASVLVVGCGGVGSHAALSLARSGVRYVRLIDMDMVTLSSLNRHACATLKDVGSSKVAVLKTTIEAICGGHCEVDARCEMYTGARDDLLEPPRNAHHRADHQKWDYVIDAIDDIPTKTSLLAACFRRNVRVVSCMGAAGKADPTRLHLGDLNGASRDPLATKLRNRLKKIKNLNASALLHSDNVTVIYSSEKVVAGLADFTPEQLQEGVGNFGAIPNMRVRVLPVLGTMPAMMGQACAAYALCELGQRPFTPVSGERLGRQVRHRALQHLKNRERAIRLRMEGADNNGGGGGGDDATNPTTTTTTTTKDQGPPKDDFEDGKVVDNVWVGTVQVDLDDCEFLISTVWRQKCAIAGTKLGTVLELVRWDMSKPSTVDNLVLMSQKSFQKFDACRWNGAEAFGGTTGDDVVGGDGSTVVDRVEGRLRALRDAE